MSRKTTGSDSIHTMHPVLQDEPTGCAIASVAALAGLSYARARRDAARLGLTAADPALWGTTGPVRRLLAHYRIRAGRREQKFIAWECLPNRALLAIKWHRERNGPAWHWVVFVRDPSGAYVLDPKRTLRTNHRTDFGRMTPKWFIRIDR